MIRGSTGAGAGGGSELDAGDFENGTVANNASPTRGGLNECGARRSLR